MALANLSIYYTWKNVNQLITILSYNNNIKLNSTYSNINL